MKKILIGYLIDGKSSGIDKYLLNVIRQIRDQDVKIDCLTNKMDPDLQKLLQEQGVGLFEIPNLKHPGNQLKRTREIIRQGKYDVAYFNISEAFNCIGAMAAHKEQVPCVAVHSHSSGVNERNDTKRKIRVFCHNVMKRFVLKRCATDFYACSEKAGEWLFPESVVRGTHFHVINNAVDVDKFGFDPEIREKKRKELGVSDKLVVGQIGFHGYQKNPEFVIAIAEELKKINPNSVVWMIGTGDETDSLHAMAKEKNLGDHLRFLGVRSDVNELTQAMDLFVLPSRFEGLPIVAIEAQMSGLKVLLSDTISGETALSDRCIFLSIQDSAAKWAERIQKESNYDRENWKPTATGYCFDIEEQKKQIAAIFGL